MEDQEFGKKGNAFEIGQDLSAMSIEELAETMELLRSEIERLEAARNAKSTQMAAAESLFNSKG